MWTSNNLQAPFRMRFCLFRKTEILFLRRLSVPRFLLWFLLIHKLWIFQSKWKKWCLAPLSTTHLWEKDKPNSRCERKKLEQGHAEHLRGSSRCKGKEKTGPPPLPLAKVLKGIWKNKVSLSQPQQIHCKKRQLVFYRAPESLFHNLKKVIILTTDVYNKLLSAWH